MEHDFQSLDTSVALLQMFDYLSDGIIVFDAGNRAVYLNASACSLLGVNREEFKSQTTQSEILSQFDLPATGLSTERGWHEVILKKDTPRVVELQVTPFSPFPSLQGGYVLTLHDITHHKQIEQDLRESESLYHNLFEISMDAIILTDVSTKKIYDCNQSACDMNGYSREELVGQDSIKIHGKETANLINDPVAISNFMNILRRDKVVRMEVTHRTTDGRNVVIESCMSLATLRGRELILGIDRDITIRKHAEEDIRHANEKLIVQLAKINDLQAHLRDQAEHDSLTKLFNRHLLNDTLEREISRTNHSDDPFSLLMIDVDHFKKLNDAHGHQAGDAILKAIGEFLSKKIRKMDSAFRYGGEEFLIVMSQIDQEKASERADDLRNEIASLQVPYRDKALRVTVSIGVACYPFHAQTIDDLLQTVDNAMYQAKKGGRNRVYCP